MKYSYLALGDSYTIGEQVNISDSFPYQTVQLLRQAGINFYAPEIIATTGWTTNQLISAMDKNILLPGYDFVTVLIGVNNQYQGKSVEEFRLHLRSILEGAIQKANGVSKHVIVLSIPDWGVTPFANKQSTEKIRVEIDMYNFICQAEAEYFQTHYIDITQAQRADGNNEAFLAPDQLHPSGKEYAKWARKLADEMMAILKAKE